MKYATLAATLPTVALSLLASAGTAGMIVVDDDGGPGVDHTTLGAALAAAASGDTILVKEGIYGGGFTSYSVSAMSLEIVGEKDEDVRLNSPLTVADLGPSHVVRISGVTLQQVDFLVQFGPPLRVQNCAGSVWVEDCAIHGPANPLKSDGTPVAVFNCEAVTFARCQMLGGTTSGSGVPAPKGMITTDSNVYVFDCSVQGGAGLNAAMTGVFPTEGGAGAIVTGGLLYAQRSSFTGGSGGDGGDGLFGCTDGEAGGAGIVLAARDSIVRFLNSTADGGPGGAAPPAPCVGGAPGPAGTDVDDALGSFFEFSGSGYSLAVDHLGREGEPLNIAIDGEPGDFLWLWITPKPAPVFLPPYKSPFLLDLSAFALLPLGAVPPGGTLSFAPTVGELGPGVAVVSLYLQIAGLHPLDGATAGGGQAVSLLDSSF